MEPLEDQQALLFQLNSNHLTFFQNKFQMQRQNQKIFDLNIFDLYKGSIFFDFASVYRFLLQKYFIYFSHKGFFIR